MKKAFLIFVTGLLAAMSISQALADEFDGLPDDEAERKYYEEYSKAEDRAVRKYPAARVADSEFSRRVAAIDRQWEQQGDPRFHDPDKPELICDMVAKAMGIAPAVELEAKPKEAPLREERQASGFPQINGDPIPEFLGYKSVRISRIEPDGIRIIHEYGAAKIAIENLPAEVQQRFGLTAAGASEHRADLATAHARHQETLALAAERQRVE